MSPGFFVNVFSAEIMEHVKKVSSLVHDISVKDFHQQTLVELAPLC